MRKKDEGKASFQRAAKTINFEKLVLDKLEDKARKENTTVTNIVNSICRQIILKDVNYFAEKAKEHYIEFQKYKYLQDQAEIRVEVG